MKIIVNGAGGRMGRELISAISARGHSVAAGIDMNYKNNASKNEYSSLDAFTGVADCIIDFSHHSATDSLTSYAIMRSLPLVIATTGHNDEETEQIAFASTKIPVFMAPNMSIGVALLADLSRRAVRSFPDADVEIVEVHHNQKLDVPSGTALFLAKSIKNERPDAEFNIGRHENGKRKNNEIGIHSIRMGSVFGQHEVYISTPSQTIKLSHEVHSRAPLAEGAVAAAEFTVTRPAGLYGMSHMLNKEN